MQHRRDEPQVRGDRRLQGQQLQVPVSIAMYFSSIASSPAITVRAFSSSRCTSASTASLHRLGRELAHREQLELDALQRLVELFARHPNLPVT